MEICQEKKSHTIMQRKVEGAELGCTCLLQGSGRVCEVMV